MAPPTHLVPSATGIMTAILLVSQLPNFMPSGEHIIVPGELQGMLPGAAPAEAEPDEAPVPEPEEPALGAGETGALADDPEPELAAPVGVAGAAIPASETTEAAAEAMD